MDTPGSRLFLRCCGILSSDSSHKTFVFGVLLVLKSAKMRNSVSPNSAGAHPEPFNVVEDALAYAGGAAGELRPALRDAQRVRTMNSVPRPVSRPSPWSEMTSEDPGIKSSLMRSSACCGM